MIDKELFYLHLFRAFALGAIVGTLTGCATLKNIFTPGENTDREPPIENPFDPYLQELETKTITLRTKKGDQSIEVELPDTRGELSEFIIPVSPEFSESLAEANEKRIPASISGRVVGLDESYKGRKPTLSDLEIEQELPRGTAEDDWQRREIEGALGLSPVEKAVKHTGSYLGKVDLVKQLFRRGRYEAAILEVDTLLQEYPTNPKLYEMKGTLLERLGYESLALKSWNQALRLNPSNKSLERFVGKRKEQRTYRGLASPDE